MKSLVVQPRDNFLCRVVARKSLTNSISRHAQKYSRYFFFVQCKRYSLFFQQIRYFLYTYLKSFIIQNKVLVLLCILWFCCILQFHVKILNLHRQKLPKVAKSFECVFNARDDLLTSTLSRACFHTVIVLVIEKTQRCVIIAMLLE